jgi:hypothetical protein
MVDLYANAGPNGLARVGGDTGPEPNLPIEVEVGDATA